EKAGRRSPSAGRAVARKTFTEFPSVFHAGEVRPLSSSPSPDYSLVGEWFGLRASLTCSADKCSRLPRRPPASIPPARQPSLACCGLPVVGDPPRAALPGDAGLLPLRRFDDRLGLTRAFAAALDDPRDPDLTAHPSPEMVRCRAYGARADYEDQSDHDT